MENINEIREQFPITRNRVFLNHAAQSPLPKPVADAIHKYVEEFSNFGHTSTEWKEDGRPLFARLIGATPEEIALVENTSVGMNIAANVLQYPPAAKIVTTDLEYPSVVYPWLRKRLGVKVHYVKNVGGRILLDDVEKAVDDKTVAVAISHVEYSNGFRNDLRSLSEIAHKHGAYLIVDAIQSVGAIQVDIKRDDVDFLTASCYKWLLSPAGIGYLYVKKELIEEFEPPFAGWASVKPEVFDTANFWDIWNLELSQTARRFEIGSPNYIGIIGATEAMKLLLDFGIAAIENRILKLTDRLIEALKNLGLKLQTPEEKPYRSGVVLATIDNPKEVVTSLRDRGMIISARSNGLRISPHFYNTEAEIDTLIEKIKQCR